MYSTSAHVPREFRQEIMKTIVGVIFFVLEMFYSVGIISISIVNMNKQRGYRLATYALTLFIDILLKIILVICSSIRFAIPLC